MKEKNKKTKSSEDLGPLSGLCVVCWTVCWSSIMFVGRGCELDGNKPEAAVLPKNNLVLRSDASL